MNYVEMIRKKNNYAIILIAVTIVVGLLIAGFGIYPLYKSAATVTKQADQKAVELKGLKARKTILDGLKDKEDELRKNAELVASALPEGRDVGGLFIQVNGLAARTGGTVRSVSGGSTTAGTQAAGTGFAGIQKYNYSVPASFSSYFAFKDFVAASKSALRLLNINDITISSSKTGGLDVMLNITTYARN